MARTGMKDHPRIRGEHKWDEFLLMSRLGSSPHTRGAPPTGSSPGRSWRIIPAYAGSTSLSTRIAWHPPDHPRIRGEHRPVQSRPGGYAGSSPHTRGARVQVRVLRVAGGIIPAYAGSTIRGVEALLPLEDHPRIRGEHDNRAA